VGFAVPENLLERTSRDFSDPAQKDGNLVASVPTTTADVGRLNARPMGLWLVEARRSVTHMVWRGRGVAACSLCLRVALNGSWVSAESAIRQLRTYERSKAPRLRAALCPGCEEEISLRRAA
jgi:hypothetical protein